MTDQPFDGGTEFEFEFDGFDGDAAGESGEDGFDDGESGENGLDDSGLDEDAFGEHFFASLEASPDDPVEDPGGLGEFDYESEGDGSFETDTAGFEADDLHTDGEEFDLDTDSAFDPAFDAEPDLDPDHDFDHEGDYEFGPDPHHGFGPG